MSKIDIPDDVKIIESFEDLNKFISENYPDYNNFYWEIEPMDYIIDPVSNSNVTFDLICVLSKREKLLTKGTTIKVGNFNILVESEDLNTKLVALCTGDKKKVIPVLEEV